MTLHRLIFLSCAIIANLAFVSAADAQLLSRWFGPKGADKNAAAKSTQPDPRRVTEVNVEIAWLADPVTFPYYLEAHATASGLEVRGYVPDKSVRDHALRIARVQSSLPVTDSIKEHPSLLVRPTQMSAQQLQTSVMSSLRAALPKQHSQLKAECGNDGKVYVVGPVNTQEERMAVSHSLRRLHGCTSVQNLTTLPSEVAMGPRDKTPIIKTSNSTEKAEKPVVAQESKAKPWWPFTKAPAPTKDEPPLLEPRKQALKGPAVVEPKKGDVSSPQEPKRVDLDEVKKTQLPALELQKRIQTTCPQVKSVEVQFRSATEATITLEIRSDNELKSTAERVFALPELQNIRAELQFKVSTP